MFGIKKKNKTQNTKVDYKKIAKKIGKLWPKIFPYLILGLLIVVLYIIGSTWYKYVYNNTVSEQEINEYVLQKSREASFKREKFETIEQGVKERRQKYNEPKQEYVDIFYRDEEVVEELEKAQPIDVVEDQDVGTELFKIVEEDEEE
jgi:hypothetical protein